MFEMERERERRRESEAIREIDIPRGLEGGRDSAGGREARPDSPRTLDRRTVQYRGTSLIRNRPPPRIPLGS